LLNTKIFTVIILIFQTNKDDDSGNTPKLPVKPQLVKIYLGIVKWSLQAMDVHMVNPLNNQNTNANFLRPRSKEEKEAMDHLSGIVSILSSKHLKCNLLFNFFFLLVFSVTSKYIQRNIFYYNCIFR